MTDPNAQNQQNSPQGSNPWANPMDAPPPFPDAGVGSRSDNPYTANPYAAAPINQYSSGSGRSPYQRRPDGDDRVWAMLAHLSAPIAAIVSAGWLTFLGPLIVWFVKRDSSPFVRNAAAGAFNFSLTMALFSIVGWILNFTVVLSIIGIPMVIIGALGAIILGVYGALKAWNGVPYTYPWQLRILS
ncbi:MAG TPA: DUF4870 domain-containing protein [Propioniciclava sp.]|jgi:uncharacterized Tic20 family protein|uniref:DUF4870 domain-containing protein n=1 Tax=Propioniciclava sp. TaxID=2038686 RepID=UPI002CADD6A3|nr:DUF4870 domain-containing protein [Propioniciclava sp.]HRL49298.1 DUF4870 domain-containing protein [Propioniciclava sp.]HRL79006.1 DUF4870 domain-containing protein [Propioniciclava sp.]